MSDAAEEKDRSDGKGQDTYHRNYFNSSLSYFCNQTYYDYSMWGAFKSFRSDGLDYYNDHELIEMKDDEEIESNYICFNYIF